MDEPTLDDVRTRLGGPGAMDRPDRSYERLLQATGPAIDPGIATHRAALHRWLNAWGCRIRYARDGETDHFDASMTAWWRRWRPALRDVGEPLAGLSDERIQLLADAFGDLTVATVARHGRGGQRTMGPTAAAKCLYALRPRSVMPWDDAIARRLHGARDGAAFADHLRLGRRWANGLLDASGLDEARLVAHLGRSGSTLARVLDEYCYVRCTLDR